MDTNLYIDIIVFIESSKYETLIMEDKILEIKELKCSNCNKKIYVRRDQIREKMFCTLGCLYLYKSNT